MEHIDKIAIGVALLIIVGGALWAISGEDPGARHAANINEWSVTIENNIVSQNLTTVSPPAVHEVVAEQFNVGSGGDLPEWLHYRRPAYANIKKKEVYDPAIHVPSRLTGVEVQRDASLKKAIHILRGHHATAERAKIVKSVVEVRLDGEEQWQELQELPAGSGAFELRITTVEAGQSYSYRIKSMAESRLGFQGGGETQHSNETGPVFVPPNEAWRPSNIHEQDIGRDNEVILGSVIVQYWRWDYDKNKVTKMNGTFHDSRRGKDWKKLPDIFDTGYRVRRIGNVRTDSKIVPGVELRTPDGSKPVIKLAKGIR
ncbi:MAG: hypothetical protein V3T77_06650, partial [Planctomycetota bacterium]